MEPVYTPVISLTRLFFAAQGLRFRVTGAEHVPASGGAVLVVNHTGYLDFMFAGLAARPQGRLVRFMAKEQLFRHRIAGPLLRGMKHIPVDRERGAASFDAAVRALRDGEIVGVFPEATISRSFELKDFKTGAVRMAAAAGVPIVPVAMWGGQRVWTKGKPRHLGRTGTPIGIRVGEPFTVAPDADPKQETALLKARLQALLDVEQRDYPRLSGDDLQYLPRRLGGTAPTLEEATAADQAEAAARRAAKGLSD